jgi:AcrR family transcriptional regulator
MGRPRIYDHRTRVSLLRAAERLAGRGGADAVTVRRVAEAAGTTTRAVYSVFGSKAGLLAALNRESFRALTQAVDKVPRTGDPLDDLVRVGVLGFRQYALRNPDLFRLVFEGDVAYKATGTEDAEVRPLALARLRERVGRCAQAGLLSAAAIDQVVTSFHALCQGLASLELQGRLPLPRGTPGNRLRIWREALRALVLGFAPGEARRQARKSGRGNPK